MQRRENKRAKGIRELCPNATVVAYSQETSFIAYELVLHDVTREWIRKLLRLSPRAPIRYQHELDRQQLAAIESRIGCKLRPDRFHYYFDGDAVASVIEAKKNLSR